MIIDAHRHVWDTSVVSHSWVLDAGLPPRESLPDMSDVNSTRRFILVEADADDPAVEADSLVNRTRADSRVRGAVVCIRLETPGAAQEIGRLAGKPEVVGVRRLLQDRQLFEDPQFAESLHTLAGLGLPFDACVRASQIPELTRLAERHPDLTFVLDHMGKPPIGERRLLHTWARDLESLAQLSNVNCKISGLPAECHSPHQLESVAVDVVGTALQAFGAERCLVGSDSPVSRDDEDWCSRVMEIIPVSARKSVGHSTAEHIYSLRS